MEPQYRVHRSGVLVVDNNARVRETLDEGLRQEGFAVWLASDTLEALDLYTCHRHEIDFVLLEVCMPGMDGPQTLAVLQKLNRDICCCLMTSGYTGNYTEEELLALGARALFNKPFDAHEAAQVLRRLVGRPQQGPHKSRACPSVLSWRQWARGAAGHG
jgi:CheY-like chemotaxis protein